MKTMTAMKQTYQHPYIEVSSIEMELTRWRN